MDFKPTKINDDTVLIGTIKEIDPDQTEMDENSNGKLLNLFIYFNLCLIDLNLDGLIPVISDNEDISSETETDKEDVGNKKDGFGSRYKPSA